MQCMDNIKIAKFSQPGKTGKHREGYSLCTSWLLYVLCVKKLQAPKNQSAFPPKEKGARLMVKL